MMPKFTRIEFIQWRNAISDAIRALKKNDTKQALNTLDRSFALVLHVEESLQRVRDENEKMMATDYWHDRYLIVNARVRQLETELADAKADYEFLWKMRIQYEKERSEKK